MNTPAFQKFQQAFCDHIREPAVTPPPKGVAARGMKVYNEIVFNNLDETLSACFPVCKKILGTRRWKTLVRAFMTGHRCATPLFRQIPEEFLRWLECTAADLPPYFSDLAHYEWIELAIALSDAVPASQIAAGTDSLLGKPQLAPAMALLRYDYPVHRISPRFKPATPETTCLLVFRNRNDEVRFIELNAVTFRLLELLSPGTMTGLQALETIAAELRHPDPAALIGFGRGQIEAFIQEEAIWGVVSP